MTFEFKVGVVIGIVGEIRAVNLWHHGQRRPPFFIAIAHHGAKKNRRVFKFFVVGNLAVVAQLHTDRPVFI